MWTATWVRGRYTYLEDRFVQQPRDVAGHHHHVPDMESPVEDAPSGHVPDLGVAKAHVVGGAGGDELGLERWPARVGKQRVLG